MRCQVMWSLHVLAAQQFRCILATHRNPVAMPEDSSRHAAIFSRWGHKGVADLVDTTWVA